MCLNFGARASGWYWGRVAGLMVRTSHALLDHHHALWQYVDDLLAWLEKHTAPLWASALIILFLLLGIPMSWHKASLATNLTWIGWHICIETWTLQIPDAKLVSILAQVKSLQKQPMVSLKELQSCLGRLLWLTGAWHHLRPLLIILYRALSRIPTTMVGVNPAIFQKLIDAVDDHLFLKESFATHHHSLEKGTQLVRVANTFVTDKGALTNMPLKSRRVWLGIVDPSSPHRVFDDDAQAALQAWFQVLSSSSFCMSMFRPQSLAVTATADAMAYFPDGSRVWFQFQISRLEAQKALPWVGPDMQKHIAAWELLAQFALTFCVESKLPSGHAPATCHQGTDNSAADAAAAKGITMTTGMSQVLSQYFLFMRRSHLYAEITHIPGYQNVTADALSRFEPLQSPLDDHDQVTIDWLQLLRQDGVAVSQPAAKWPSTFRVRST